MHHPFVSSYLSYKDRQKNSLSYSSLLYSRRHLKGSKDKILELKGYTRLSIKKIPAPLTGLNLILTIACTNWASILCKDPELNTCVYFSAEVSNILSCFLPMDWFNGPKTICVEHWTPSHADEFRIVDIHPNYRYN